MADDLRRLDPNSDILLPQQEVNYRRADGEEACVNCLFFISPAACELVQGPIAKNGLCDLWNQQDQLGSNDSETLL